MSGGLQLEARLRLLQPNRAVGRLGQVSGPFNREQDGGWERPQLCMTDSRSYKGRSYVLRLRDGSGADHGVEITEFDLLEYRCGLWAGDLVRLTKDLPIVDHDGRPTGVHRQGEIWGVVSGSHQDPDVLWLQQPNGDWHTWDDDESVWDQFERVDESAT